MLALRDGRIDAAKDLINTVLKRYPDPTIGNRTLAGLFGEQVPNLFGPTFAAFGNLVLGQYNAVLRDTEAALLVNDRLPDLYFMQGYAHCNLQNYPAAEAAYTRAIELDPSFTVLYLLRAEARQKQGDLFGAQADIATVQQSNQQTQFAPLVTQALTGQLSCKTFFK